MSSDSNVNDVMFSVIIPVYNVSDYLSECIESVLAQTCQDFEIILVDDGSNDGSEHICDQYAENHGNISVVHKKNGGQSSARNIGVDRAKGQYFIFIDSDDYISPETLEMLRQKIDHHGQLDVILSERMFDVEPDGRILDIQRHLDRGKFEGITGRQALIRMGMEWSPCGKCFRTAYWRNSGFKFTEGIISEDFQLIDRVTMDAKKVAMVSPHYYYRWKNQSSTMHANYEKLVRDTSFVIMDWEQFLNTKELDDELVRIIKKTLAKMLEHEVMGNVFYAKKIDRNVLKSITECKSLLKYDMSIEGKMTRALIGILGVRNTCFLLNILKKYRKKRKGM